MFKRLMLLLTAIMAVSASSTNHQPVRDIPQPPCWPCTSLK
jgi:hypothetical protein